MRPHQLLSDQLKTWSATHAAAVLYHVTKAPPGAAATITAVARRAARFAHRAIQALRQSWLQMRRGPWPWPEVLPFGELPEATAADGLRTPGVLHPGPYRPRSLPTRPRDPRADLRDQSRTVAPTRGALTRRHEPGTVDRPHPDRRGRGRFAARQYARRLARPRSSGGSAGGGR
jgi:hypothetical protein